MADTTQQREPKEFTKVVTVRMPQSLHTKLFKDSHYRLTSLNRHCIDLLNQPLHEPDTKEEAEEALKHLKKLYEDTEAGKCSDLDAMFHSVGSFIEKIMD